MKTKFFEFIKSCEVYQRCKGESVKSPCLLQPLPIQEKVWQDISINFIEGLSQSHSKSVIMVVVDKQSKYTRFIRLKHPYIAASVAQAFLDNIYKLHGLPQTIVSYKDVVFLSKFWQSLFDVQRVHLHHFTTYHSQSDGQTELSTSV